ncbi:MAG TPA: sigma-70 family RNA polymerase sigma factor [Kofleriaceae bacterium]|nr:sigma-70 family RNA polymerase sigma factor [Kofleriaceae bacterium]
MLSVLRATRPVPDPDELDELAIARAAAGDKAASRALVERYQVRIFALVSRMLAVRGRAVIEDVAQDAFLDVFRRLREFRPGGPARLSTWILTIAARRAIDELRRRRPEPRAEVEIAGTARADAGARRREVLSAIEAALAELSPELRAAFLLREFHDLEYAEIAQALAIDLGTVKSRLSRARTALRERLAEVHDD